MSRTETHQNVAEHAVPVSLIDRTFAIQYNPNCASPWLVRLPNGAALDMKWYGDAVFNRARETKDHLGFGATLAEAAEAVIEVDRQAAVERSQRRSGARGDRRV